MKIKYKRVQATYFYTLDWPTQIPPTVYRRDRWGNSYYTNDERFKFAVPITPYYKINRILEKSIKKAIAHSWSFGRYQFDRKKLLKQIKIAEEIKKRAREFVNSGPLR